MCGNALANALPVNIARQWVGALSRFVAGTQNIFTEEALDEALLP